MVMMGVSEFEKLDACIMGIDAGLDMFIFRNSDIETINMLNSLVKIVKKDNNLQQKVMQAYNRIINIKTKYCI